MLQLWQGRPLCCELPRATGRDPEEGKVGKLEVLAAGDPAVLGRVAYKGNRQSLEAVVECCTSKGWKKAKALIDSGAQLNLVSQLFVKEAR